MYILKTIELASGVEATVHVADLLTYNMLSQIAYISVRSFLNPTTQYNGKDPLSITSFDIPFPTEMVTPALVAAEGDLELLVYQTLLSLEYFDGGILS